MTSKDIVKTLPTTGTLPAQADQAQPDEALQTFRREVKAAVMAHDSSMGKWKAVADVGVQTFGLGAFLAKTDGMYDQSQAEKLKLEVEAVVGVPAAPPKDDKSPEADKIRSLRKEELTKVSVYMSRMRGYAVPKTEKDPDAPKPSVLEDVKKLISKLEKTKAVNMPSGGRYVQWLLTQFSNGVNVQTADCSPTAYQAYLNLVGNVAANAAPSGVVQAVNAASQTALVPSAPELQKAA